MTKRGMVIGAVAVAAVVLGGWLVIRSRSSGADLYRVALVTRGTIQQTVSATGTLSAVKTVQVGTRVSGQVAELHADFNDHVTKGELLARIDPTLQQQAVADAEAQLARTQAQYAQAKAEEDRNAPLFAQKFVAASDFNTIQMNTKVAAAAVQSAQVTLSEAKQNLSYTDIISPINGVVIVRSVDVGQTVAASLSTPQLFLIAQDLSQIQILAAVDESDIAAIKDSQTVKFTVEAYPDTFTARVAQVRLQSQLTDNVVNYTVVVLIDNTTGKLLPGMTATVQFITGSATDVLTVPNLALRFKPTADELSAADTARPKTTGAVGAARTKRPAGSAGAMGTVYTLDAANKLKPIRVRIGLSDGQRTQVTSDSLSVGMKIVLGIGAPGAATTPSAASTNPLTPQRGGGAGRGGP